ncbi:MAG: lasso peptide biosynthesis B2 protein [Acidobacteriota bacterium]
MPAPTDSARTEGPRAAAPGKPGFLTGAQAFLALVSSRLIIRVGKFQLAHRVAEKWPTRGEKSYDFDRAEQLVALIDRSSRFTTTKSWCLQRSLAAVLLLRFHGVPAELTIGVRRVPFYAHAWAELAGRVINDSQIVREKYAVIEQC